MVLKLTYFIQDYLEAYNFEKPSSVYDEMLKNQQKQEADKATNEKKRKDIILMLEQKKVKFSLFSFYFFSCVLVRIYR